MEITKVSCNGCGGALEVPASARFVTCRYCGASLEIKRTDSAIYSEILERIDQRTAVMAEDLGAMRREQEIERLDREWAMQRESLLVRGKEGASVPSATGGFISIAVGVIGGMAWMSFAASMHGSGMFPLFGLVFIAAAVLAGMRSIIAAGNYQRAEETYRRRRAQVLASLDHADRMESPVRR